MQKKIIFHHPLPLNFDAPSGSGIRPVEMYKAFIDLGYDVELVVGYSDERKKKIQQVIEKIRCGQRYDFCYSEASTMPLCLTDKDHIPRHPLIDVFFFRFVKRKGIKTGVFYRDIYWKFEDVTLLPIRQQFKKYIANTFYRFELLVYNLYAEKVFVPSLNMTKYIPTINRKKFKELNPGAVLKINQTRQPGDTLELFYVGGTAGFYNINLLIDVIGKCFQEQIRLTICTRESDARSLHQEFPTFPVNVSVVSFSGEKLNELYENADCACLYVEPTEYRMFAVPIKLFEYVANGKPVIASAGTWAGEFVAKHSVGWKVEYSDKALKTFLEQLLEDKASIPSYAEAIKEKAPMYSWKERCKEVEAALR